MANPVVPELLELDGVEIMTGPWRNFTGEARKFNNKGDRNFNIKLPEHIALDLIAQGWKVKALRPRDEDLEMSADGSLPPNFYHMTVKVSFNYKPPQIWMVTTGGRIMLGEGSLDQLDQLEIVGADLELSPYINNPADGLKTAYLRTAFIVLYESRLAQKWGAVPVLGAVSGDQNAIGAGSMTVQSVAGNEIQGIEGPAF